MPDYYTKAQVDAIGAEIGARMVSERALALAASAGSTLGLQQQLLADAGQPGLTVLAIGSTITDTSNGKAVVTSLGEGNVVRTYASGPDFVAGNIQFQEFMGLGEDIAFTEVQNGTIITSTEGAYGFSEQKRGNATGPMPLMSYGLATKRTFFRALRNSNVYSPGGTGTSQGWVNIVCGPIAANLSLLYGDGTVVQGQANIPVEPWGFLTLYTDGNVEYIVDATENVMMCHSANMSTTNPQFYDPRLIMPLSNELLLPPRSGQLSAPFDNTIVQWYTRDGVSGSLNSGLGVSPGSPVNIQAAPPTGTGANDADYEPNGWTLFRAAGLISAYSGADSAGVDATAGIPTKFMSQRVAQPLHIADVGDGGNSGVAIASKHPGTARLYQWNQATGQADLAYTVPLTRFNVTVSTREDQFHPCGGMVANETVDGAVPLVGSLGAGYVEADVPITVVVQNGDLNFRPTIRSQNGATAPTIASNDDEVLALGWTPNEIAAEIRTGTDGLLYRRDITSGVATWPEA